MRFVDPSSQVLGEQLTTFAATEESCSRYIVSCLSCLMLQLRVMKTRERQLPS